jgi:low affinity Fe/Cu permease
MSISKVSTFSKVMETFARATANWAGSSWAFLVALLMTVVWLISGPVFGYSDTWQLIMNTISSIVTFLMVFLIQRSQNKDALAMQIKLDEIVAVLKGASNRIINIEGQSEDDLKKLKENYRRLAEEAGVDQN